MEPLLNFLSIYNAFGLALLLILVPGLKILLSGPDAVYAKIAGLLEENDHGFESETGKAITATLGLYKKGFFTEPGVAKKFYLVVLPLLIILACCLYYIMYKYVTILAISDIMKQYIVAAIVATPYGKFTKPVVALVILVTIGLCVASL